MLYVEVVQLEPGTYRRQASPRSRCRTNGKKVNIMYVKTEEATRGFADEGVGFEDFEYACERIDERRVKGGGKYLSYMNGELTWM